MRLFGRQIAPADVALALAGVLGALAYALLLPQVHPDSTARHTLAPDEVERRARAFVEQRGYPTDGLEPSDMRFQRDEELLTSLQHALGRGPARRLLADSSAAWPAYHWHVEMEGRPQREGQEVEVNVGGTADDEDDGNDDETSTFDLSLTQDGEVYEFTHASFLAARDAPLREQPEVAAFMQRHLDRDALDAALRPPPEGETPLAQVSDSLLARFLTFDLAPTDSLEAANDARRADSLEAAYRQRAQRRGGTVVRFRVPDLKRDDAARMARFHLRQAPLGPTFAGNAAGLRADSVWTPPGTRGRVAAVRFEAERRGQTVRADVEVFATGGLRALDATFNPDAGGGGGEEPGGWRLAFVIAGVALAVLIGIGLLVAFFRRLSRRMIDVRAGAIDAVVLGLTIAATAVLATTGPRAGLGAESFWATLGLVALIGSLTFAFPALFAFPFTAAADAVGRSAFSGKVLSMSMVRRLAFRNRYVGAALLRGTALAGALLGLAALTVWGLPGAAVQGTPFFANVTFHPFTYALVSAGMISYGMVVLALLGLGAFVWRYVSPAWARVGCLSVAFALFHFIFLELDPFGYDLLLGAVVGVVAGAAFARYDALTAFTGLFAATALAHLDEGWLVAGSPAQADLLLGLVFFAALGALGLVGVWSGKTGRESEDFTPSYITELAERERLKRDIEIAEEVQRSFLPRRMPQPRGLELAALCLPAREVGGDYYDFVALPEGRLGVVIGDVSGKGIEASFYMTLVKGFLQTLGTAEKEAERAPAAVLRRLNALFRRNAPRGTFIMPIKG